MVFTVLGGRGEACEMGPRYDISTYVTVNRKKITLVKQVFREGLRKIKRGTLE